MSLALGAPRCAATILFALSASVTAQNLHTVVVAQPGGRTQVSASGRRLAIGGDGSLWAGVWQQDAAGNRMFQVARSSDGGITWQAPIDTTTTDDGAGAIAAGTGCHDLHVVWHAKNGGTYTSVYHQVLDTGTGTWRGSPQVLLAGVSSSDQYSAADIAVTASGSVVALVQTNRQPPAPWTGSWNAGLMVKRPGQTQWQGPFQINVGSSGTRADIQVRGEVVHCAYRSAVGGYGIFHRRFDAEQLAWLDGGDVPVGPNGNTNLHASNANVLAIDGAGDAYVLYATGQSGPGQGEVWLAHASAGNYSSWTQQKVYDDPPLAWGNTTYSFYSLTVQNDLVLVQYSKAQDGNTTLYQQGFAAGQRVFGEVPLIVTTQTGRFTEVTGFRDTRGSGLSAIVNGTTAAAPDGIISVLLTGPAATSFAHGASCPGSLPDIPWLVGNSLPQQGSTFHFGVSGVPAGSPGILLAGFACLPQPLSLDFIGFTGCELYVASIATLGHVADAAGHSAFTLQVPAGPAVRGATLQLQNFSIAPGANPGGGVLTNALVATVY